MLNNNPDFYPTPKEVVYKMIDKLKTRPRYVLEPSAGKGNIVDCLNNRYRQIEIDVIEPEPDLVSILNTKKCSYVGSDFLEYGGVCYYDAIIMNPPFSNGAEHLLKAWDFLNSGEIVCLLNSESYDNPYSKNRKILKSIIDEYGTVEYLGNCFSNSERKTDVNVILIHLTKESDIESDLKDLWSKDKNETDNDRHNIEDNYLAVQDKLGNMQYYYDSATQHMLKAFDHIRKASQYMSAVDERPSRYEYEKIIPLALSNRNEAKAEFTKKFRKDCWKKVFSMMEYHKFLDKIQRETLLEDIEKNSNIPFTKENIKGTLENIFLQRHKLFEKSVVNVFDELIKYHEKNKIYKEGWKTNSNYMVNQKIIFPYGCTFDVIFEKFRHHYHGSRIDIYNDLDRVICGIEGKDFSSIKTVYTAMDERFIDVMNGADYKEKFESEFFIIRFYKKGTVHLTFKDKDVWRRFNKTAAKGKNWIGEN